MRAVFGVFLGAVLLLGTWTGCQRNRETRQPTTQLEEQEVQPFVSEQGEPFAVEPSASFATNVVQAADANTDYRRVLFTGPRTQLVLMSLPTGQDIGMETHRNVEQIIVATSGTGRATIGGVESNVGPGDILVIPPGTPHDVINAGATPLHLYTIYSPPNHIDGRVQATKQDALDDAADQQFAMQIEQSRPCPRR